MKEFKEAGFTENLNEKGLVMYSDDQYFCRYTLGATLKSIDEDFVMGKRLIVACNGQQILDYLDTLLLSFDNDEFEGKAIQPVALLFLDINMPILNGLKTVKLVKERYKTLNEKIAKKKGDKVSTYVLRPLICHLTSFEEEFKQLITLEEEADLFLVKPL